MNILNFAKQRPLLKKRCVLVGSLLVIPLFGWFFSYWWFWSWWNNFGWPNILGFNIHLFNSWGRNISVCIEICSGYFSSNFFAILFCLFALGRNHKSVRRSAFGHITNPCVRNTNCDFNWVCWTNIIWHQAVYVELAIWPIKTKHLLRNASLHLLRRWKSGW